MTVRRPDEGENREHTRAPSFAPVMVARHLWVARANACPRTYLRTFARLQLLYIPFDSSVTRLPRASCELSRLGTCNTPLMQPPHSSHPLPLRRFAPSFSATWSSVLIHPPCSLSSLLRRSSSIHSRDPPRRASAFFAYPLGAYVTEQIGDGESYVGSYLRLSLPMYRIEGGRRRRSRFLSLSFTRARARVASGRIESR